MDRRIPHRTRRKMNNDDVTLYTVLGRPPARLTVEQTAVALNFQPDDIPILAAARLLKPLGNPGPTSVKYYAAVDILQKAADPVWLSKATAVIQEYWRKKNRNRRSRVAA